MTKTLTLNTDNRLFAPPLERWHYQRGRSLYRLGGVWTEGPTPFWGADASRSFYNGVETDSAAILGFRDSDVVPVADRPGGERTDNTDQDRYAFFGGRNYVVSDAVAATLTAAGYGAMLS